MQLKDPSVEKVVEESEVYGELLSFENAKILELGCGAAKYTRHIATNTPVSSILALEVDEVQHAKNLLIDDLPNVEFKIGYAEDIPCEDEQFDIVMLFKSLHHVPMENMDKGLSEIKRVLKPGGVAYISEPIFGGDFNEVLRIFHDEEEVRLAAFHAVKKAVDSKQFELVTERFFNTTMEFKSFQEFDDKIVTGVTHRDSSVEPELMEQIKAKFAEYTNAAGITKFTMPMRVDLLKKPLV